MQKTYQVVNDHMAISIPGESVVHAHKGDKFTVSLADIFHKFDHLVKIGYLKLVSVAEDPPPPPLPPPTDDPEPVHQADGYATEEAKEHDDE